MRAVLGTHFHVLSLQEIGCNEELPETHDTIEDNAAEKAGYVWNNYHVPCFADDSGLEVNVLHGAPGVDSAHFAGPQRNHKDNVQLLLTKLDGIDDRSARFRTVIALFMKEGSWLFEATLAGVIVKSPRGTGGFGYDPVFLPVGFSRTLAEMTLAEKNEISHRAIAVTKLASFLAGLPNH